MRAEAWQGPPEGVLGWWKSHMPERDARKLHWAPNDVMLELLEGLESQPDKQDMRYVLALLLIRRRVVRLEETEHDATGARFRCLYCPRRETTYRVVDGHARATSGPPKFRKSWPGCCLPTPA